MHETSHLIAVTPWLATTRPLHNLEQRKIGLAEKEEESSLRGWAKVWRREHWFSICRDMDRGASEVDGKKRSHSPRSGFNSSVLSIKYPLLIAKFGPVT